MRIIILLIISNICIQASVASEPAKVMVLGSFHFANPSLDVVKTKKQIDVTTEENQTYLNDLSERIATKLKPDSVLVECERKEQLKMARLFSQYSAGELELEVNEIYQLGFRVAKKANLKKVICFDEQEIQWKGEELFESLPVTNPSLHSEFQNLIAEVTTDTGNWHKNLSLKGILQKLNQKEYDDKNKSFYLFTNGVDAGASYVGADAAASWWHRNFRMYANVQKEMEPNSRILVIAGHGHTAILKDFVKLDEKASLINSLDYL